MGLCRFSSEYLVDGYTLIDNLFIGEYMPFAAPDAVKVYLFGLYQCQNPSRDNTIEFFVQALNLSEDKIFEAFSYWEEMGILRIVNKAPLEVSYLPLKSSLAPPKKYNKSKYSDFNRQLQELFPERQLAPNEYLQYYDLIESYHIQAEAVLMIAAYCVSVKGTNLRYPYIIAVAKDWAKEGSLTVEDVEIRLKEHEASTENLREVFAALGKRTAPDFDDRQMYLKWEKTWGYDKAAILYAAKLTKKRGGMSKLNSMLDEFYRLEIYSLDDMKNHASYREMLYALAVKVNKKLGVYYNSLEPVVETYIAPWLNRGFDEEGLLTVAHLCFLRGYRTLAKMDATLSELFKMGYVSAKAINEYIAESVRIDEKIKDIITMSGSSRSVTNIDRDFYKTWSDIWHMGEDMIAAAAQLSVGKAHNFGYMNKLLADWHKNGITDAEKAIASAQKMTYAKPKNTQVDLANARDYSKEDLNAFFGDMEQIDNLEV